MNVALDSLLKPLLPIALLALPLFGQGAGPLAAVPSAPEKAGLEVKHLLRQAQGFLQAEDSVAAVQAFRRVRIFAPEAAEGLVGLANAYLALGRTGLAMRYAQAGRRKLPLDQELMALEVRIMLRAGQFDSALLQAQSHVAVVAKPSAVLLAALASAQYRCQKTSAAAKTYEQVLGLDPLFAEAHLRLGSGLLSPRSAPSDPSLPQGVQAMQGKDWQVAVQEFSRTLRRHPGHPVAHRLLGETLFMQGQEDSVIHRIASFAELRQLLPIPDLSKVPVNRFLPAFAELEPQRQRVAARALGLFSSYLPKLVAMGGKHDLLKELERTTDAPARRTLEGRRTFDGRVWDDVRGIGGLQAATGIEALDEAKGYGFDTLSHEIAHQAHLYAFTPLQRAKVRKLYKQAKAEGRCLDFYAASNEAEYFGQGVEAFVSYGKRSGHEKTHIHTRFELRRVDPELHQLIEELVDHDPLRQPETRAAILPLSVEIALRSGRPQDALVAAEMMPAGEPRHRLMQRARRAALLARSF